MNRIELREAIQEDAAAIGALHVASWREAYAGILPDAMLAALSAEARAAMWGQVLAAPAAFGDTAIFLAAEDGGIVGFGSCGRQRDAALAEAGFTGEIGAIYVLQAHQKRGIGRALIAALSQALAARGHEAASLWVLRDNAPARAFYEALGGEIVGEKSEEEAGVTLVEIAYGWRGLAHLAG